MMKRMCHSCIFVVYLVYLKNTTPKQQVKFRLLSAHKFEVKVRGHVIPPQAIPTATGAAPPALSKQPRFSGQVSNCASRLVFCNIFVNNFSFKNPRQEDGLIQNTVCRERSNTMVGVAHIRGEYPLHWHVWRNDYKQLEEELSRNKVNTPTVLAAN